MLIIPVVDIRAGVVVAARSGERKNYQVLRSPLAQTADPVDVVAGLLRVFCFSHLYIADLDAIEGQGKNLCALARIRDRFQDLKLVIDNGAADISAVDETRKYGEVVLGTESQKGTSILFQRPESVLSLDFNRDGFIGPRELLENTEVWPKKIIVMSLSRVGSAEGPDVERVSSIRILAKDRILLAAGGVRSRQDLDALYNAGADGVLVSRSLHEGQLKPSCYWL